MIAGMNQLLAIKTTKDILPQYQQTPIASLLEYHNFKQAFEIYSNPELLIGMCMDNRKQLNIPKNFAFIIRSGGTNMQYSDFHMSFAISIGQVKHIAIIGHSDCGMVNLNARKDQFIKGLVEIAGWKEEEAKDHFLSSSPRFEIENEVEFILSETKRLRKLYPKIQIAPMMYLVEDNQLYLINEN
jgi:carbonic anhydrase